jgi:hypothetical protein
MEHTSVFADEFAADAVAALRAAREGALEEGHPVVFRDADGRLVEEHPDGRRFEIRLDPSRPAESRRIVIRELSRSAA